MRFALRRGELGLRVFTLVLALAFTLQSYVTQTHIHGTGLTGEPGIVKVLKGHAPAQAPSDSNDNGCAFCQAVAHSGAFFAPTVPILLAPVTWAMPAPLPAAIAAGVSAFAHSWQSRAPPKA